MLRAAEEEAVTGRLTQPFSSRYVLALAIPALGALAADPLLSLVDTAFVGRLGVVPLAALGVDVSLFSFAFALFNFLAYVTTPLVAQARGRGDMAESGRVVVRAVVLALAIGVLSAAALGGAAPLFVRVMQAGPAVVAPAVTYLRVRALAVPALLLITAGHGSYRGFQDTRTPLYVTLVANGLNAVFDPLLMFRARMGLAGAAWATAGAQWVGALWFLWLLARRAREEGWPLGFPALSELAAFLRLGGVLVARTLFVVGSLTAATAAAARIGTREVAAHQVVQQVWFLMAMIVDALAIAAQALVGDLIGRGDSAGARALADRLFRWGLVTGVVLGGAFLGLRPVLGGLFSADPGVTGQVATIVPIAAGMQPLAALVFVADGVFLGVLRLRLLAVSTGIGLAVTVGLLVATLVLGWGLVGVWWAVCGMVAGRAVVLGGGYLSGLTTSRA